jgi:threonine/homoserine/homoserine lactone efflux protein
MVDLRPLLTIAALDVAAAMSPGPAFLLVSRTAAGSTRRSALLTAGGTASASVIWAAAALLGVQMILTRAAGIYHVLQFLGGLYLCYIGISIWRGASVPLPAVIPAEVAARRSYGRALLLGLSNPKIIVFFGTIFTTAFDPSAPAAFKLAALLVVTIIETTWYTSLATLFGISPIQRSYRKMKKALERTFGSLMFLFGGRLTWSSVQPH